MTSFVHRLSAAASRLRCSAASASAPNGASADKSAWQACLLLTAYCLLPTAYCLLPTAYCPPASAHAAGVPISLPQPQASERIRVASDGRDWGRVTPDGERTQFTYDDQGRIVRKKTIRRGRPAIVITYVYDENDGQVLRTEEAVPDPVDPGGEQGALR